MATLDREINVTFHFVAQVNDSIRKVNLSMW